MDNVFYNSTMTFLRSKKHKGFKIGRELQSFEGATKGELPQEDENFVFISVGGFSTVAVIAAIARKEKVNRLFCSTFRIGRKQFNVLCALHRDGQLDYAELYTSKAQASTDEKRDKYNYIDYIETAAKENGWIVKPVKNHSKIILCETALGNHYVIETSSNLNENPQIEFFSLLNDKQLFEFYENNLFGLLKNV